mmetsp:Transcript_50790/g.147972  ORF Transcript_50790/g.147972 Transcript_50790/m.147972 type:complete len:204 (+) Transcript_50790:902-1513(+)
MEVHLLFVHGLLGDPELSVQGPGNMVAVEMCPNGPIPGTHGLHAVPDVVPKAVPRGRGRQRARHGGDASPIGLRREAACHIAVAAARTGRRRPGKLLDGRGGRRRWVQCRRHHRAEPCRSLEQNRGGLAASFQHCSRRVCERQCCTGSLAVHAADCALCGQSPCGRTARRPRAGGRRCWGEDADGGGGANGTASALWRRRPTV